LEGEVHSEEYELSDGRIVQQSLSGRYRDKRTGKWVSTVDAESLRLVETCALTVPEDQSEKQKLSTRDHVFQAMQQAARKHGYPVESLGEAWGKVMQVQAEIALDKDNAAKATAAAKLLAQATKIMDEHEGDKEEQPSWFVLGRELAWEMLTVIQDERCRREGEDKA
jgi:hypothetical protein